MKACFKCGAEKPLSEFYAHAQMADGHLNKCKSCTKFDAHQHRHGAGRDRVLQYDKSRGARQGPEYRAMAKARNPVAHRARYAVGNAVRDGRLVRPDRCSHCSKLCAPHGHHHDYGQPLNVTWLCVECHRNLHALLETIDRSTSMQEELRLG